MHTMRVLPCRVNNRAELLPYMEIRTRMEYNDTIQSVKGIGEKTAALFSKLNVRTVASCANIIREDMISVRCRFPLRRLRKAR